jgi:hypothetical protein
MNYLQEQQFYYDARQATSWFSSLFIFFLAGSTRFRTHGRGIRNSWSVDPHRPEAGHKKPAEGALWINHAAGFSPTLPG